MGGKVELGWLQEILAGSDIRENVRIYYRIDIGMNSLSAVETGYLILFNFQP